ncbi:hypothetical protein J6590_028483 [Homalodisca vitripennis]|nr:hypothetical protein J6590_028483 [Homalodisca vitripennis]
MFRAVTRLSFLKRHPQSSFRLTSNEIKVPTTNVKDLKGSNEDMKELVVKDKFVVVHWNGLRFPGLVLSVAEEEATVECMAPTKKFWKWPQEKHTLFYKCPFKAGDRNRHPWSKSRSRPAAVLPPIIAFCRRP